MRIFLIGYMGSGKSTVGRILSRHLGFEFIDTDQKFEETYRISITDFFSKYGEENFRLMERKILQETFQTDNLIISTGGGTSCYFDNLGLMKKSGITIFLSMNVENLTNRLIHARKKRPLLMDMQVDQLHDHIHHQLEKRLSYYCLADITIDINGLTPDRIIDSILEQISRSV